LKLKRKGAGDQSGRETEVARVVEITAGSTRTHPEWVSRLTEVALFVAHHLSLPPAVIEIHPGDARNSVDDIINAVRFIQEKFRSGFGTHPIILLENRTEISPNKGTPS